MISSAGSFLFNLQCLFQPFIIFVVPPSRHSGMFLYTLCICIWPSALWNALYLLARSLHYETLCSFELWP